MELECFKHESAFIIHIFGQYLLVLYQQLPDHILAILQYFHFVIWKHFALGPFSPSLPF